MSAETTEERLEAFDLDLFPNGVPSTEADKQQLFELYRIMVASSEALVGRRQGVNTFFLTMNGALLTAIGLVVGSRGDKRLTAVGVVVLTVTGAILAQAWRSLIGSFGQLNKGKFRVINRIEQFFPAAIYWAEWKALDEGKTPRVYRTFSSREVWTPWVLFSLYVLVGLAAIVALASGRLPG
jgi:hypothetical protein